MNEYQFPRTDPFAFAFQATNNRTAIRKSIAYLLLILIPILNTELAEATDAISSYFSPYFTNVTLPKSYRSNALSLMLIEANQTAKQLNLPEPLPITTNNIAACDIPTPTFAWIGTISTHKYFFSVGFGRKLGVIDERDQLQAYHEALVKYSWPIARKNTSAATQFAREMMAAFGIDVKRLDHNCKVEANAVGPQSSHFVPIYRIRWLIGQKTIADFEYLEPTRTVRHLAVYDPSYNLRKAVVIPGVRELLMSQGVAGEIVDHLGLELTNGPAECPWTNLPSAPEGK